MRLGRRRLLVLVAMGSLLAIALVAVRAGNESEPAPDESDEYPVDPYVDPAQLRGRRDLSFYAQPWRGYLETVPAVAFLDGLGVNYNLPLRVDPRSAVSALAQAGFRRIRVEVSWAQIGPDDRMSPDDQARLERLLAACVENGITPVILLNANQGAPGPHKGSTVTIVSGGEEGSTRLVLSSVDGLVEGRSGLSDLGEAPWMAEVLFTSIDRDRNEVALSKPLPMTVPAQAEVRVDTLSYLPLYPVGTPEFDETVAGWLRYVDAVTDVAVATGVVNLDIEIWNELTFGSNFLSIDNYYSQPITESPLRLTDPGGRAWELARRTVDQVHRDRPGTRVIWGFSNTNFFGTPVADLPPRTDGQSYHPYHTSRQAVPSDFPPENETALLDYVPEGLVMAMPEGQAQTGATVARLSRLLEPGARLTVAPAGSTAFAHYITEHGFAPGTSGVTDPDLADRLKAKALLRETFFWLGKGITAMTVSSAWKADPLDNGLLPASPANELADLGPEVMTTTALRALTNAVSVMARAQPLSAPRPIDVEVTAIGVQPEVFPGDDVNPPLPYRELFTFLPFQVDAGRFVFGAYVMGYDITDPPLPMDFRITIRGVDGTSAAVSLYDPLLDEALPLREVSGDGGSLTVTMTASDYPRLLIVDE